MAAPAASLNTVAEHVQECVHRVSSVVRGKDEVVAQLMVGLLAKGHVLLEDVPGVGKTTLARCVARVVGAESARLQLTADLLPSDILGAMVLDPSRSQLVFRRGPVFTQVLLADELNRATPRAQSGLLEAMAESKVTVDGTSHPLPQPFFVIATQNPVEHHGTYRLPQSQLDRFLLRTALGYPDDSVERALVAGQRLPTPNDIEPVIDPPRLLEMQAAVDSVRMTEGVAAYLQAVVGATRSEPGIRVGASTRGLILLARASRARALTHGRDFVVPDDVYSMAVPCLAHRLIPVGAEAVSRSEAEALMQRVLHSVPAPV